MKVSSAMRTRIANWVKVVLAKSAQKPALILAVWNREGNVLTSGEQIWQTTLFFHSTLLILEIRLETQHFAKELYQKRVVNVMREVRQAKLRSYEHVIIILYYLQQIIRELNQGEQRQR